jgi:hypothetical protein
VRIFLEELSLHKGRWDLIGGSLQQKERGLGWRRSQKRKERSVGDALQQGKKFFEKTFHAGEERGLLARLSNKETPSKKGNSHSF